MKFPKLCLTNTVIFLFIIIIIGIYFYKGVKEGFTTSQSNLKKPTPYKIKPPPKSKK